MPSLLLPSLRVQSIDSIVFQFSFNLHFLFIYDLWLYCTTCVFEFVPRFLRGAGLAVRPQSLKCDGSKRLCGTACGPEVSAPRDKKLNPTGVAKCCIHFYRIKSHKPKDKHYFLKDWLCNLQHKCSHIYICGPCWKQFGNLFCCQLKLWSILNDTSHIFHLPCQTKWQKMVSQKQNPNNPN